MRIAKTETMWNYYFKDYLLPVVKDFVVEERNGVKKVVIDSEKNFGMIYRRTIDSDSLRYMWLFNSVKQSFVRYAKSNPKFEFYDMRSSTFRNVDNMLSLKAGDTFLATDINHCYWRIAYLLGYINEKLYKRCLPDKDSADYEILKQLRNKALACVKSPKKKHIYKNGKHVKTIPEYNRDLTLLYDNVRNKSYGIMHEISKVIWKGFIKYKVDCIYYKTKHRRMVEIMMRARDVNFKTVECLYIGDGFFVENDEVKKL